MFDESEEFAFALKPVEMKWTNYDFVALSVLVAICALCLYVVLGMNHAVVVDIVEEVVVTPKEV